MNYPDDLQAISDRWLNECGPHDYGVIGGPCRCHEADPRPVIAQLVNEVAKLRLAAAELMRREQQHEGQGRDGHLNETDLAILSGALDG